MKKFLIIVCIGALASCKTKQPADPQFTKEGALDGNWVLEYTASGDVNNLYPASAPTLFIDLKQSRASGKNGCNNYSAPITVVGNKLSFSENIISTKMACPGDGEKRFMDAIQNVDAFSINPDGKLSLMAGNVETMRFVKN